jgi:hypothetical protein
MIGYRAAGLNRGLIWLAMALAFELFMGRVLGGKPWSAVFATTYSPVGFGSLINDLETQTLASAPHGRQRE